MKLNKLLITVLCLFICASSAYPCTGVFMNKDGVRLVGRTMDWPSDKGSIYINDRGIKKTADIVWDGSPRAKWTSKYGSVTFNMVGKFNPVIQFIINVFKLKDSAPTCGMNEKGLWGGGFWIHPPPTVKYPAKNGKISINNSQLLEYLLDTSANVDEAILNLKKTRIAGFKFGGFEADLHWFLADASGNSALIDFPDGKLVIHRHPVPPVITNSFYEHNKRYLSQFKGFGGKMAIPLEKGETTSENRYVFATYSLTKAEKANKLAVSDVFNIMKSATQTNVRHASTSQSVTQWTAVYDLKNKKLSWFSRINPKIRSIDLAKTDFSRLEKTRKMEF